MKRKQGLIVVMLFECGAHKYIGQEPHVEKHELSQEKGEPNKARGSMNITDKLTITL